MRNVRNGILVLLTVLISDSVLAQSKTERYILNLSKQKFVWLIEKQRDSLDLLLDDRLMYIHSNGWTQSKVEVFDDIQSGKLVYKQIDVEAIQVRLYGNTAIVTGTGRFQGSREDKEFDLPLSYTEVYVKEGKRWVLVSRHANRML
ncbi:MAG: nuclear transport factor 2 family protein [Cyclobacteriaceae bacterium]|nr:MAG: nuclear transport factor 2 family protein [Cyclobacteriaceae bacterium]